MAAHDEKGTPLFCAKVKEKRTGKTLYLNLKAFRHVEAPDMDITVANLVEEERNPTHGVNDYKVPFIASPIFWSKLPDERHAPGARAGDSSTATNKGERDYVVEIGINDRFAYRKVLPCVFISSYVVSVALSVLMDKYNDAPVTSDPSRQYLGHKVDFDQPNMKILKKPQQWERSNEIVRNKIVILEADRELTFEAPSTSLSMSPTIPLAGADSSAAKQAVTGPVAYDLHLRPALKVLTCSISTEKLPTSIGFNDDRLRVELDDGRVLDVHIPLSIDLSVPIKYKFDDRLCLMRIVLSVCD